MGLLDILFLDSLGIGSIKVCEKDFQKCSRCNSENISISQSFDSDNIKTETYVCNDCVYTGGYSIA